MTAVLIGGGAVPAPPDGSGGLLLTCWFVSKVELTSGGAVVNDRPNYETWVDPPEVRIDGEPVRASWSSWWYPLPPGPHHVEIGSPAPASTRVEVTGGDNTLVFYRADLRIQKDAADTEVLERRGTGSLRAGKRRPSRRDRVQ